MTRVGGIKLRHTAQTLADRSRFGLNENIRVAAVAHADKPRSVAAAAAVIAQKSDRAVVSKPQVDQRLAHN